MDTVLNCLVTDSVGPGEYLDRFQKSAREALGFEFGFAVRSPLVALGLALDSLALTEGDAVAVPKNASTAQAGRKDREKVLMGEMRQYVNVLVVRITDCATQKRRLDQKQGGHNRAKRDRLTYSNPIHLRQIILIEEDLPELGDQWF